MIQYYLEEIEKRIGKKKDSETVLTVSESCGRLTRLRETGNLYE